jgi:hypothetical protein
MPVGDGGAAASHVMPDRDIGHHCQCRARVLHQLSSKFWLSTEPRCLNSGTTGASPSARESVPLLDRADRLIGRKLARVNLPVNHRLPKVHCNSPSLTCRMRHHLPPQASSAAVVENPGRAPSSISRLDQKAKERCSEPSSANTPSPNSKSRKRLFLSMK